MKENQNIPNTRAKTSAIWAFFTPHGANKASCNICKRKFSYKSSVTNLKSHLTRLHPIVNLSRAVKSVEEDPEKLEDRLIDFEEERPLSEVDTQEFIKTYKLHPALWDKKSRFYKNGSKKSEAYEQIAEKFDLTLNNVKRKVKELDLQYRNELHCG